MKHIAAHVDAMDILVVVGFVVLVTGVALYSIPLALVVSGGALFALGIVGSR